MPAACKPCARVNFHSRRFSSIVASIACRLASIVWRAPMQTENLATRARSYIAALELPPPPARSRELDAAAPDPTGPALAVGPNLVEFAPGADPALRPAMTDALLLAQLAADKADARDPDAWYAAHHEVLSRLGFLGSGLTRTSQDLSTTDADLHEAILPVITAAFAGAAIPAIVIATLEQLSTASENRPWIPAFRAREPPVLGPAVPGDDGRRHRQRAERRDARLRHRLRPRDGTGAVLPARKGHRRRRADRRALRGGQPRAGRHRAGSRAPGSPSAATPISRRWRF